MSLRLYTGNRLETLAARLAALLSAPTGTPLRGETIVVQSQGMARWLKLELARRHGVCANIQFPFPEKFADDLFASTLNDVPGKERFSREAMTWIVLKSLPALLDRPGFAAVRHYLRDPSDGRRRFQLAARIAYLFDQYAIFRPQMVLGWDAGQDTQWQAELWRAISRDSPGSHRAALRARFEPVIQQPGPVLSRWPARVAVFGISALPPFHVSLFAALGRHLEVHLFLLEASREYWGDITSGREADRLVRRAGRGPQSADALHLEEGNRLLASMGKLGRDFLGLVWDAGDWDPEEHFEEPGEATLLTAIQSDILHLRNRGRDGTPRLPIDAGDDSLQIHSCHSPMREMEVLQDHLLEWFQRDPSLTPREVLVMTPDLEAYAPFIQAVFETPEREEHRIPFSVADRSPRRRSHVVETFLALLDLAGSRLGAPAVLAVLEAPAVQARFGLGERDLDTIRGWIGDTRIRWGADAAQRERTGLPPFSQNTWRSGLDRLLLGYAMAGGERTLFNDILPFEGVEGEAAGVLGRFAEFIERLFTTLDQAARPHALRDWSALLQRVLNDFFASDDQSENELRLIREAATRLAGHQELSGFIEPVELAVILEPLTRELAEDTFGSGFLSGGVTFCALKPMRSIPFKIICLVGLDDGAFPRATPPLGFDLMARQPKRGDRSTRDDDRYLFLETLLSARQRLYLSYVGQSVRDNGVRPPSVVIGELLDYVEQGFIPLGGRAVADRLVCRHRLQAFSEDYFRAGTGLFSYSADNCLASHERQKQRSGPAPFLGKPLPAPEPEWRTVEVESLGSFFANPAKFLLTRRLGLQLVEGAPALDDREPFVLAGREKYQLRQTALEWALDSRPPEAAAALVRAGGQLPLGTAGDAEWRAVQEAAEAFHRRLTPFAPGETVGPVVVDLTLGEFRITGRLGRITPRALLRFRCAKLKARDLVRVWIEHLVWNHLNPPGHPRRSVLVATDETRLLRPVSGASQHLQELLGLYWRGLSVPLKFFPQTSLAFAEAASKAAGGSARTHPLAKARREWEGDAFHGRPGDRDDPFIALCFRDRDEPFDEEFADLARTVFNPLLEHQQIEES